jgi:hypothetical protein
MNLREAAKAINNVKGYGALISRNGLLVTKRRYGVLLEKHILKTTDEAIDFAFAIKANHFFVKSRNN